MKEMNNINKRPSLGESVDLLREDVAELYDLDEDNWNRITLVQTSLDQANNKIAELGRAISRNRRKMVFGFIGVGGLIYFGKKVLDAMEERIQKLEQAKAEPKQEEASEESDG